MTSEKAEEAPAAASRGSRPYLVLVALFIGLVGGTFAQAGGDGIREPLIQVATYVGGLWLDALKMTVIPLIVALLVTGIAKGAEAARAGRIAGRSILWFVIVCTSSAIFGAVMMSLLVRWFPLPQGAGEALQAGLAAIDQSTSTPSGAIHSTQPMTISRASAIPSKNSTTVLRRCGAMRATARAKNTVNTTSGRTSPLEAAAITLDGMMPRKKSAALGIGERLIFNPYSKELLARTRDWVIARGILPHSWT